MGGRGRPPLQTRYIIYIYHIIISRPYSNNRSCFFYIEATPVSIYFFFFFFFALAGLGCSCTFTVSGFGSSGTGAGGSAGAET